MRKLSLSMSKYRSESVASPLASGRANQKWTRIEVSQLVQDVEFASQQKVMSPEAPDMIHAVTEVAQGGDPDHKKVLAFVGIPAVLELMQAFMDSEPVQHMGMEFVCLMSYDAEGRVALGKYAGTIVMVLQHYVVEREMQLLGMKAMVAISVTPEGRELLSEGGGVAAVLRVLQGAEYETDDLDKEALRALINLSFVKGNHRVIQDAGGIPAVKQCMERNRERPSVIFECLRTFYNLSYQDNAVKTEMVAEGLIAQICDVLKKWETQENMVLYGLQALTNLAVVGPRNRELIGHEGIQGVLSRMRTVPNAKLYSKVATFSRILAGEAEYLEEGEEGIESGFLERRPIPIGVILQGIEKRVQSSSLSGELLLYIPFLVMYIFIMLGSAMGEDAFYMAQGIAQQVTESEFDDAQVVRTYTEITTSANWFRWINGPVTELFAEESGADVGRQRHFMGNTMLLGSLRIRIQRVHNTSCIPEDYLFGEDMPYTCYAVMSDNGEHKSGLEGTPPWVHCDEAKGAHVTGDVARYHCGGTVWEVPFNYTQEEAAEVFERLEASGSINDLDTRFVIVEFFMYNPVLDTFGSTKLYTEVAAGGAWRPREQVRVFKYWTEQYWGQTFYDCVFFAVIIVYAFSFIQEWKRQNRVFGRGRQLRFLTKFWNVWELVNLGAFGVSFSCKWMWFASCMRLELEFPLYGYPAGLDPVLAYWSFLKYTSSINTILTFLLLLKFLAMNDNFNFLTRTMAKSKSGIFTVLGVYVMVLVSFAILGNSMYGNALYEFRNLNTACSTLLRLLIGDFDYGAMRDEQQLITALFFWSYTILGLFIYMNFLLAVISDGFTAVSEESTHRSLSVQIARAQNKAKGLSIVHLLHRLRMVQEMKSLSKILRLVLEDYLIPYRRALVRRHEARRRWRWVSRHLDRVTGTAHHNHFRSVVIQVGSGHQVDDTEMSFKQFKELVPKAVHRLLGDVYFRDVWEEILWQHDLEISKPKEQARLEEIDMIQSVARKALSEMFLTVESLQHRVTRVMGFGESTQVTLMKPKRRKEDVLRVLPVL